jgi:hypothetical protein
MMSRKSQISTNVYLNALPPYYTFDQFKKKIAIRPNLKTKAKSSGQRKLIAGKLLYDYFEPLGRHYHLFEKIYQAIFYGYENRTKLTLIERIKRCRQLAESENPFNGVYTIAQRGIVRGFSLVGLSGVGKSIASHVVLELFQTFVKLTNSQSKTASFQMLYLKVDCSPKGSTKQLCLQIFLQIDRILGTDNYNLYNKKSYTEEALMIQICFVVTHINLGVLIIDEIQNLRVAKGTGRELMLNFFKTLSNWIGVPIVFIGTTESIDLLRQNFQEARRKNGIGSLIWDRLYTEEAEWKDFIKGLWKLQVLKKPGRLTSELSDTYHDLTQGIPDLLVVLHVLGQQWALDYNQESIEPGLLKEVAKHEFWMLEPMLEALRTNDIKALETFADINIRDALMLREHDDFGQELDDQETGLNELDSFAETAKKLLDNLSHKVIDECVKSVVKDHPHEAPNAQIKLISNELKRLTRGAGNDKAKQMKHNKNKKKTGKFLDIFEDAKKSKQDIYDELRKKGFIMDIAEFLSYQPPISKT